MIVIQDLAFEPEKRKKEAEPEKRKKEAYHAAALVSIAAALTRLRDRTVSLDHPIRRRPRNRRATNRTRAAELKAANVASFTKNNC
jgi:hypothetical protein